MKRRLSRLLATTLNCVDGPLGRVQDFYFDDFRWTIRYLVCRLPRNDKCRTVLVPSGHFRTSDWDLPIFPVALTREEVLACPPADSDMPVSRQRLQGLGEVIFWPDQGGGANPSLVVPAPPLAQAGDPHLRSFATVRQYRVESPHSVLGTVKDFIIDDESWSVKALVVQLTPWYRPKTVLVYPQWARDFDWAAGCLWTDIHPIEWQRATEFSTREAPQSFFETRSW